MSIRIVRLGTPRLAHEGTRIGTVRRPPRGVPKAEFASGNWYDVWYPNLSPTPDLVKRALASQADLSAAGEKEWAAFTRGYKAEMKQPENARTIELLAALSQHAEFSVGCYCESEARCHRSILRELLEDAGAKIARE